MNEAVIAARKALKDPSWKDLPPTERGNLMIKLSDLIEANKELLATIDAWDNGLLISQFPIALFLTPLQAKHTRLHSTMTCLML